MTKTHEHNTKSSVRNKNCNNMFYKVKKKTERERKNKCIIKGEKNSLSSSHYFISSTY